MSFAYPPAQVLFGLVERVHYLYNGAGMLFACLTSFVCTSAYGINRTWDSAESTSENFRAGFYYTFIGNGYEWKVFIISICTSIGAVLLAMAVTAVARRFCG